MQHRKHPFLFSFCLDDQQKFTTIQVLWGNWDTYLKLIIRPTLRSFGLLVRTSGLSSSHRRLFRESGRSGESGKQTHMHVCTRNTYAHVHTDPLPFKIYVIQDLSQSVHQVIFKRYRGCFKKRASFLRWLRDCESNPMHFFSRVSRIIVNGAYS